MKDRKVMDDFYRESEKMSGPPPPVNDVYSIGKMVKVVLDNHPVFIDMEAEVEVDARVYVPKRQAADDRADIEDLDFEVVSINGKKYSKRVMNSVRNYIHNNWKNKHFRDVIEDAIWGW